MEQDAAERLTQLSATLMAGWIAAAGRDVNLEEAPVRQIVELAEKLQARAEKRVLPAPPRIPLAP